MSAKVSRRILGHRGKLLAGTLIAVPCATIAGSGLYIAWRVHSKPPDHQFRPLVDESGALLIKDCRIEPPGMFQLFWRLVELARVFVPVVVLYMLWGRYPKYYRWWLHKLLAAVERAGPAFIKAGQWSCTRNDLFAPEFREVFRKLYSEVSIHSFEETRAIISAELGKPVDEIFSALDPVPVGSGSIGQVHRGVLKENGREVAVKVMHPRVVELIAKDFFVINWLAKFVDKHVKSMEHLEVSVQALAWTNHLAAQLDFRIEAEHLDLFNKNFMGTDYVRIPEAIQATQRVLIESFVPGEPATEDFLGSLDPHVRDIIASKGLNCFCKMLLCDNFVHGDLHPGNILVDARDPHNVQVSLIDVGLCMKLSRVEGERSNDLMSAFVKWDADLCRATLLAMGRHQRYCDQEKFKTEVDALFSRYRPIKGDEEGVVENILQSMFEATRNARVTMDPGYVNIMFSVLVLEGFIMALNPEYNMVRHAAPWLVGEGHLSTTLIKNIIKSGWHAMIVKAKATRSRILGGDLRAEPYVPKRRPRFDPETGSRIHYDKPATTATA
jgi:aarF domain-containing kinase